MKKIRLRPWTHSDCDDLVRFANNKKIADHLADAFPYPYTTADGTRFIDRVNSQYPTRIFAVEYDGKAVGSIGIFPDSDVQRKNAAIAYWIAEPYWGLGIATEAIAQIVDYGLKTFDLHRIYAKPYGTNLASHRVLEKASFKLEATLKEAIFKNGSFQDELIYVLKK